MDSMDYRELMPGAEACVKHFVKITERDKVLIITDKPIIAEALAKASNEAGAQVIVFYLPRVLRPIKQLSEALKSVILESTVVFTPFDAMEEEFSFRKDIVTLAGEGDGRRIAHMISVTPNMFSNQGMIALNPREMGKMTKLTEKLAILLSAAKKIKIRSASHEETDLCLDLGGWSHSGIVSTGYIMKRSWGNLPSGEAFVIPKRGTASGTIVIDMGISGIPGSELPVTIGVNSGIIDCDSTKNGELLKKLLERYPGHDVRTVCEFGIGTNPKPSFTLATIEIEKILRTIHIAIGNNSIFGGDISASVPHTDMVISRPTVTIEDLQSTWTDIIEEGIIREDRIDTFFKVRYTVFPDKISGSATVKIFPGVWVEDKEGMLYRCWKDHRGNELRITVGDDDTARKVKEVWSCIDPSRSQVVTEILKNFNRKYRKDGKLAFQLLNTLEKFGVIEISESSVQTTQF
ncbi:MAG: hypothetical protein KAT65_17955 [Methanophagales archaeon]|nr:hypothetical protein [Methanophagales archaeon]